jgi:hypothetical protein
MIEPTTISDALMEQGLNKYDALLTSGEYATSNPKDAQILALQTQVQNLEDTVTKRPKCDKNPTAGGGDNGKKRKGRETWQLIAPKSGEPTSKTVNGRTFHWCSKPHGHDTMSLWGVHEPAKHKDTFKRKKTGSPPADGEAVQEHVATLDLVNSAFNEDTKSLLRNFISSFLLFITLSLVIPFYLLLKLFPHAGSIYLKLFVMYNLLHNRILAYEAREGEKQNPILKINIHKKGDSK